MRKFRKLSALLLALTLVIGVSAPALAVSNADILGGIGVFLGTDKGYELDRAPTRTEGLVMLVRLMGEEDAALACTAHCPFTDVPDWAVCYAAYAYETGLTRGQSADHFGALDDMSERDYCTFLLRCLGYSDSEGDFTWAVSVGLCRSLGLCPDGWTGGLTRGDMVDFTVGALGTPCKGVDQTLCAVLVDKGAIDAAAAALGCSDPENRPADTESRFAAEVLRLVNVYRTEEGLPALAAAYALSAAAMLRADELNTAYGHTRPGGRAWSTALGDAGISYSAAGENIALGQLTPEEVVGDWMGSESHRENILNPGFTQLGVGVVKCTVAGYSGYCWVELFVG